MHTSHCLNCQAPIAPKANFCTNCGQNAHLHRLSIGHIIHDGLHFFLHADKSIFALLKALATKTGTVGREFIAGKRKKYFPPLNFFLIVAGLLVISISFFNPLKRQDDSFKQQLTAIAEKMTDPVKKKMILDAIKRKSNVDVLIKKYSNIIAMCILPLVSFIFYLFYRKAGYNYAEHIVANLYSIGFTSLISGLVFLPLMSVVSDRFYLSVLGAYMIFEFTYRSFYYTKLLNQRGAGAYLKAFGISFLTQMLWIIFTAFLMVWYLKSGMSGLFA